MGNKKCENLPENMKTPSSTFSFFLSESEEESCRGVAEAAGSSDGGQDKKRESNEGMGELHAMKVRHELTVIISN